MLDVMDHQSRVSSRPAKKIYFHSTSVGANRNPADRLEGRKSICLNKYDFTSMHGKFGTEVKSEVKRGARHKEDKKKHHMMA